MCLQLCVVEPVVILSLNIDSYRRLNNQTIGNACLLAFLLSKIDTDLSGNLLADKAGEDLPEIFGVFLIEHLQHKQAVVRDAVLPLGVSGK